jgi:hypothetical protein
LIAADTLPARGNRAFEENRPPSAQRRSERPGSYRINIIATERHLGGFEK